MQVHVMGMAEGDRELVPRLDTKTARLREGQVVRRAFQSADQARLAPDGFQVGVAALPVYSHGFLFASSKKAGPEDWKPLSA